MYSPVVYIKAEEAVFLTSPIVHIGDVAAVYCSDTGAEHLIEKQCIYQFNKEKKGRAFISVLILIREVERLIPGAQVRSIGQPDMVVSYKPEKMKPVPGLYYLKILLICLTCFFGTGVSIMEYNNDVDISTILAQLYETFTGVKPTGPTFVEFFYSLGLALGIFLFFNHLPGSREVDEPTPIQVQMRLYERDINQTFITDATRKGNELEVKGSKQ